MQSCKICKIVKDETSPFRICSLTVSVAGLNPDQFFLGYTFVTYKKHFTELYHLSSKERAQFCEEMIRVAKALDEAFHPDKMNYMLLGNLSPHMHWHLIPRYKTDPFWGGPIGAHEEKMLNPEEYKELIRKIREHL